MITLHKTEIACQNNTFSIFLRPQNFTNHLFRAAHVLLGSHPTCRDQSEPSCSCPDSLNSINTIYSTATTPTPSGIALANTGEWNQCMTYNNWKHFSQIWSLSLQLSHWRFYQTRLTNEDNSSSIKITKNRSKTKTYTGLKYIFFNKNDKCILQN